MKYFLFIPIFLLFLNQYSFSQSKLIIKKTNGTTTSLNLTEIKSISFISNLIQNDDFKDSLKNWSTIGIGVNSYHPNDPGRADFTIENGTLAINIKNQGISIYSIMLYQSVYFEKGATYNISFEAKSDLPMQIISNVTQDGTYTNFTGDRKFNITSSMASYNYEFTMNQDGAALFQFCLGMIGTGKIYLNNIVVMKK